MVLKFYVKNQTLVYNQKEQTASGSKNYLYADFKFSNEWSGLSKTAVFVSADETLRYHMLLEDGRCAVPSEVIAEGGFYVSVFGGNRITSTKVFVDVSESGIETGLTPPEITDDVYDQIMDKIGDMDTKLKTMVFEYPTNAVSTAMLKNSAVTSPKIADRAVGTDKIADGAVGTDKIADEAVRIRHLNRETKAYFHTHENAAALNGISDDFIGETNTVLNERYNIIDRAEAVSLAEIAGISEWHDFNHEVGECFEIYNDYDSSFTQIGFNDITSWVFSKIVRAGKSYLVRITRRPVSTLDESINGEIEVLRETTCDFPDVLEKIYDAVNELYISDADKNRNILFNKNKINENSLNIEKLQTAIGDGGSSGYEQESSITVAVMIEDSFTSENSMIYETISTSITIEQDEQAYYQFVDGCGAIETIGAGDVYGKYTIGGVDLVSIVSDNGETGGITLEIILPTILEGGDSVLHWNGNAWEIIAKSTLEVDLTKRVTMLENKVTALEAAVGTANAELERILSEGV